MIKNASVLVSVALLSACSITQNVEPAEIAKGGELCIIENPDVRKGFLAEYQSVLESKGIPHKLVSE